MLYYAYDENSIFTFHSESARNAYCEKVDKHVKPLSAKKRYQFNTRNHHAIMLYNEECGRYSVIAFDPPSKAKRGRN